MDLLDIRLLRTLGTRAFQGDARAPADLRPRVLARQVGLSRETVRQRLARMRQEGVIVSFDLVPNYRLLGIQATTYHLGVPAAQKPAFIQEWRDRHDVTSVFDFLGDDLCVEVIHDGPTEPVDVMSLDGHPAPRGRPTALAWRFLRTVRHDALRPLSEVAKQIGCSDRTARRLARLLASNRHADVVAVVNPSAMTGLVASLFAIAVDARDGSRVLTAMADHRMSSWWSPAGVLWVAGFARTAQDLAHLAGDLRQQPGVRSVAQLLPGRVEIDASVVDARLAQM